MVMGTSQSMRIPSRTSLTKSLPPCPDSTPLLPRLHGVLLVGINCAEENTIPQGACFISAPLIACQTDLHQRGCAMRGIKKGIIGTGWIGEIRARASAVHPLVERLHPAAT